MKKFWRNWNLETSNGRQRWFFSYVHENSLISQDNTEFWSSDLGESILCEMAKNFEFDRGINPNSADLVYRKSRELSPSRVTKDNTDLDISLKSGLDYYFQLLSQEGHIPGDYAGPLFLLPSLVIISYITQSPLPLPQQYLIKQYFYNMQLKDGGWGLHIEDSSCMFSTCLHYVALRILGESPNELNVEKARTWILSNGGATKIPSWGKFFLAVLGVYEWEGVNSLLPEIWLLPTWVPIHPSRYWCHNRMVYLPMAYAFGCKLKANETDLIHSLRSEIYNEDYSLINWTECRYACATTDQYRTPSLLYRFINYFLSKYENFTIPKLRKKALDFILFYINGEDSQTNFINIGPVSQVINTLCLWHAYGKDDERFKKHIDRWHDYLWVAEDGMKMQGYNGAQLWETAFFANAILESGYQKEYFPSLKLMYNFIAGQHIKSGVETNNPYFRQPDKGGWPFSTLSHGWPITDCTADGLKSFLKINHFLEGEMGGQHLSLLDLEDLKSSVDFLLSLQNDDGGWASYEKRRAPKWIEKLNPSETFSEIMVDYSYVECTSSVIMGLNAFLKYANSDYRKEDIYKTIKRGVEFIKSQQRTDGGWYGSWGICFTYATWFAMEALSIVGEDYNNSASVKKACEFLVSKQMSDGGWGESYMSCVKQQYIHHQNSQIINTSWSVLSLLLAKFPNEEVLDKAIKNIISHQLPNGDFPQQSISGVFNKTCMITYTSYRNVFPLWALGRYKAMRLLNN